MIGLDWIGFLEREKEKRRYVSTKESSTNERTKAFSALLLGGGGGGLSFGARDQSLSIKNREQNRERSPTLPRGTQRKEDFAPEERRAKTRGYVHMHVCMHTHTHTHTHKERDLRTMSFPFFCFCARRALKIMCGVQFPIIA